MAGDGDLWLFGYGSLIWKPPPHYGLLNGRPVEPLSDCDKTFECPDISKAMCADFGSEDHRGTPEAPGRVVTLLDRQFWESLIDEHSSAPDLTWGAAYRIPAPKVEEVRAYLDLREINGYSMEYIPFKSAPGFKCDEDLGEAPLRCLCYIGLPDNPQFVGPQDPQLLAEHIITHRGPSGENKDYLYDLERALKDLSEESADQHVQDLASRARLLEVAAAKVAVAT